MTYIYVRKDLTFIQDPASQGLLKAFLKAVYSDQFIEQCEDQFGFVRISGVLRDMALASIDALVTDPSAPEFTFETDTEKRVGQGDYVLSKKRQSYSEIEQEKLMEMIGKLSDQVAALETMNADLSMKIVSSAPQQSVSTSSSDSIKTTEESSNKFDMIDEELGLDEDDQVMAALIMSSLSIALWAFAILIVIVRHASGEGSVSKVQNRDDDLMENGGKVVN